MAVGYKSGIIGFLPSLRGLMHSWNKQAWLVIELTLLGLFSQLKSYDSPNFYSFIHVKALRKNRKWLSWMFFLCMGLKLNYRGSDYLEFLRIKNDLCPPQTSINLDDNTSLCFKHAGQFHLKHLLLCNKDIHSYRISSSWETLKYHMIPFDQSKSSIYFCLFSNKYHHHYSIYLISNIQ